MTYIREFEYGRDILGFQTRNLKYLGMEPDGKKAYPINYEYVESGLLWTILDANPLVWLDASNEDNFTITDGKVNVWKDKSGNGYDFPYITNIILPYERNKYVTFDGANSLGAYGSTEYTYFNQAGWVFCVLKATQTLKTCSDSGSGTCYSATSPGCFTQAIQPGCGEAFGVNGVACYYHAPSTIAAPLNYVIGDLSDYYAALILYRCGIPYLYINGTFIKAGVSFGTAGRAFCIGVGPCGGFAGRICEYAVGRSFLMPDDIDRLFGNSARKWDRMLSISSLRNALPSTNPYKDTLAYIETTDDPYWNSTLFCINFDGENGSSNIVDAKGHTINKSADLFISTTLGIPALYFPSGRWLELILGNTEANFGQGDFTLDYIVATTSISSNTVFASGYTSWDSNAIHWPLNSLVPDCQPYDLYISGGSLTANVFKHVRFCRYKGIYRLFVGGVYASNITLNRSYNLSGGNGKCYIGRSGHSSGETFAGYMRSIRFTMAARNKTTDSFTPDIAADGFLTS